MSDTKLTEEQIFAAAVAEELARHPFTTDPGRREKQVRQAVEAALEACDLGFRQLSRTPTLAVIEPSTGVFQVRGRYYTLLAHVAAGRPQKEIAKSMSIPQGTVSSYLYRLKGELGVESTAEAISMFSRGQVVALEQW